MILELNKRNLNVSSGEPIYIQKSLLVKYIMEIVVNITPIIGYVVTCAGGYLTYDCTAPFLCA